MFKLLNMCALRDSEFEIIHSDKVLFVHFFFLPIRTRATNINVLNFKLETKNILLSQKVRLAMQ